MPAVTGGYPFSFSARGLIAGHPHQSILWRGQPTSVVGKASSMRWFDFKSRAYGRCSPCTHTLSPRGWRTIRAIKCVCVCVCVCVCGGGGWHKALVVGSVSLWRRLLASRL